jgi:hypothetical protein
MSTRQRYFCGAMLVLLCVSSTAIISGLAASGHYIAAALEFGVFVFSLYAYGRWVLP